MTLQTEFEFTLPRGYVDREGTLHRHGVMRLSTALDEIAPMRDPRVRANQAYLVVILLARVISRRRMPCNGTACVDMGPSSFCVNDRLRGVRCNGHGVAGPRSCSHRDPA